LPKSSFEDFVYKKILWKKREENPPFSFNGKYLNFPSLRKIKILAIESIIFMCKLLNIL